MLEHEQQQCVGDYPMCPTLFVLAATQHCGVHGSSHGGRSQQPHNVSPCPLCVPVSTLPR